MKHLNRTLVLLLLGALLILAFYGVFIWGKQNGENGMKTDFIENHQLVRQIAELSTLEVSGITELKVTKEENNSLLSGFKNAFFENTYLLQIPFTAKYGVELTDYKVKIYHKEKTVRIYLPSCKLISYEMRLDKMHTFDKKGILVFNSANQNEMYQKKLYTESRKNLENKSGYIQSSETEITRLLNQYFKPTGLYVEVYFDNKLVPAPKEATFNQKN